MQSVQIPLYGISEPRIVRDGPDKLGTWLLLAIRVSTTDQDPALRLTSYYRLAASGVFRCRLALEEDCPQLAAAMEFLRDGDVQLSGV